MADENWTDPGYQESVDDHPYAPIVVWSELVAHLTIDHHVNFQREGVPEERAFDVPYLMDMHRSRHHLPATLPPLPAKGEGHPFEPIASTVDLVSHLYSEHAIETLMSVRPRPITMEHLSMIHEEQHGVAVVDASDEGWPPGSAVHPSGRALSIEPMTYEQIVEWYRRANDGDYRVEDGRISRYTNGEWVELHPEIPRSEYRLMARTLDESGDEDAHGEWFPALHFFITENHDEIVRLRDGLVEVDRSTEYRIEFRLVTEWVPTINITLSNKDDT